MFSFRGVDQKDAIGKPGEPKCPNEKLPKTQFEQETMANTTTVDTHQDMPEVCQTKNAPKQRGVGIYENATVEKRSG